MDEIDLENLTDKQKLLITQISDLESILSKPNDLYVGDISQGAFPNLSKKAIQGLVGKINTNSELLQEMDKEGLGNLKVIDIFKDSKTGFHGIAFQDSNKNRGISYSGTDLSTFIQDNIANVQEYITDSTKQVDLAKKFYTKNRNISGNNYLYGHSLGGNLAEHVYLDNYKDIKNVFTLNPNHINESLLDSEEKILAFNDSNKFDCYVIGGDWVSELKEPSKFNKNIKYIKNNGMLKDNILSDHLVESASYDEYGNFVLTSKEEAYGEHKHEFSRILTNGVSFVGNAVRNMYKSIKSLFNSLKTKFLPNNEKKLLPEENDYFRKSLRVEKWVDGKTYTKEQADRATSKNPLEGIPPERLKREPDDTKIEDDYMHVPR